LSNFKACRIQQPSLSGLLLDHGMEVVQAAELIQENWISFYENELNWVHKLRQQLQDLG
jgi:hypothetical protein